LAAVTSTYYTRKYKNRIATQKKYEVWAVNIDYLKNEIEEVKLEWKTSGDVYGHILGNQKVAPISIPLAVQTNNFEDSQRIVVLLHKIK